jgi:competence protein ComEC
LSLAEYRNSPVTYVSRGDVLQLTDDVSIKILSPYQDAFYSEDDVNEGSLVMVVSYKDFDILLTGDVQGYEQIALTKGDNDLSDIDVLHIPHHGSKNSYNEKWYDAFDPDAVMISVGKDNSYGHPDPDIISYWQNRDVKVFRTDIDGSIKIEYDGKNIFYDTYVN